MSSCCHFSSRSSGVWEGNMFQWSSYDPQSQKERDLCRISSSLTGGDPALMNGTMTSIIKQSAGSLRRLIGSSITGCDQSHLFLSSAQLSPTDKMEVKAAEHKNHQKDKVSICTEEIFDISFHSFSEPCSDQHALETQNNTGESNKCLFQHDTRAKWNYWLAFEQT